MSRILVLSCALFLGSCGSVQTKRPELQKSPPVVTNTRTALPPPASRPPVSSDAPDEALRARELEASGRILEALAEYVQLSVSAPNADRREAYRLKSLEILDHRLDEDQLKRVAGNSDYGSLRGHALFYLGQLSLDRRETDQARRYFSSVVSYLPGTDLAYRAEEILSQLESLRYVDSKTIGVVLPLSGRNAAVGQRALRGIQMGLGLHETGSNLKLAVMDSEGHPDTARKGVERLVKEDKAIAIIGGLLSRTAAAEASKANELGVPSLSLSQKSGLTQIGPSVFRNALTGEMQVRELVRTAIDVQGLRRFAILYPNDAYGTEFANFFWDEVRARGGQITAAQMYDPKQTDYRDVAQRLAGTWYIEAREDEFKLRQREKAALGNKKKSVRKEENVDDVLPAVVHFDAIFIPDSAKVMGQLAAFLSYAGIKGVKLMGTNLWNSPGLAKRAGGFAQDLLFVDSPDVSTKLSQDYSRLFGESPSQIEVQAYDSALILRQLLQQGSGSREDLTRRLSDLRKLQGSSGLLEMSAEREVRRPLRSLTLTQGLISPVQGTGRVR